MKIKYIDNNGRFPLTIGKEYEVIYSNSEHYNLRNDDGNQGCYNKDRFKIVEEFPEKWCIKSNGKTDEIIRNYIGKGKIGSYKEDIGWWYHSDRGDALRNVKSGYLEITFEQFEKLVLNKKIIEKKIVDKEGFTVK